MIALWLAAALAHEAQGELDHDNDGLYSEEDCDDHDALVGAPTPRWVDRDNDGWGPGAYELACGAIPGVHVTRGGDCDDTRWDTNPGALEVCGGGDEDCDGAADEADAVTAAWYPDADGDGFGDAAAAPVYDCAPVAGRVPRAGDCDDAAPATFPGAAELCDAIDADEDCDGFADDADGSALGQTVFHPDLDGDGHGAGEVLLRCDAGDGVARSGDDCDDADPAAYPGAPDVDGDARDADCDGADAPSPPPDTAADTEPDAPRGCATTPGAWLAGLVALAARRRQGVVDTHG